MITRSMQIDGNRLAYDDVGSGPPVMLIHGFPLNRAMWRPQLGDLVAAGYRVLAPDLPGFGESDTPDGPCSMETYAECLLLLLDHLKIEHAVVGGMSMGGYVLFDLLRRHPERVSGAIFVVTRAVADDAAGRSRRLQLANDVMKFGPQVVADAFHPLMFAPGTAEARPKLAEDVYGVMVSTSSRGLAGGLLAMRERRDMRGLLPEVTVPTLVVAAANDLACPAEYPQMIAEGISGSRLVIIPGAGHLVNMEQPNLFNRHLLDFLRQARPTELNDGSIGCDC